MSSQPKFYDKLSSSLSNLLITAKEMEEREVGKWLPKMVGFEIDICLNECHTIEQIGKILGPNCIQLAKKLQITRGGMSKILTKLSQKELIKSSKSEHNQKEIYYYLTQKGESLFDAHDKIHKHLSKAFMDGLSNYSDKDIEKLTNCLEDMTMIFARYSFEDK
jgi:DNA-binding MarR family transcriptional regulator